MTVGKLLRFGFLFETQFCAQTNDTFIWLVKDLYCRIVDIQGLIFPNWSAKEEVKTAPKKTKRNKTSKILQGRETQLLTKHREYQLTRNIETEKFMRNTFYYLKLLPLEWSTREQVINRTINVIDLVEKKDVNLWWLNHFE